MTKKAIVLMVLGLFILTISSAIGYEIIANYPGNGSASATLPYDTSVHYDLQV